VLGLGRRIWEHETVRSRGRFIVLVGPDGVGKSTVAHALLEKADDPVGYFHFRPPPFSRLRPAAPDTPPEPKNLVPPNPAMGWLRLAAAVVRFWLGYLTTVRPALGRGQLVVGDRWAYGYLVQPIPLRFGGPDWLARVAIALLPRPDLVANLAAPPEIIHNRKPELSIAEIQGELVAWKGLPGKVVTFDAASSPDQVAERILRRVMA
jgi:hypothetical protein